METFKNKEEFEASLADDFYNDYLEESKKLKERTDNEKLREELRKQNTTHLDLSVVVVVIILIFLVGVAFLS